MKRTKWLIRNFEEFVGCFLVVLMVVTVTLAVIARIFDVSIVWTDELARYSFIWSVYIGSVVAVKRKGHIAIDILPSILPNFFRKLLAIVIHVSLIFLFLIIFKYGLELTKGTWEVPTTSLQIPTGLVYLSVPVSCLLMILYTVNNIWKTARGVENSTIST